MSDVWWCFCVCQREDDERLDEIGYDDVGGCKKQLAMIRELVRPLTFFLPSDIRPPLPRP
jgi:ATP-dependent 26S proteasome regulatory subunit